MFHKVFIWLIIDSFKRTYEHRRLINIGRLTRFLKLRNSSVTYASAGIVAKCFFDFLSAKYNTIIRIKPSAKKQSKASAESRISPVHASTAPKQNRPTT